MAIPSGVGQVLALIVLVVAVVLALLGMGDRLTLVLLAVLAAARLT